MPSHWNPDLGHLPPSPASSDSSFDEDEVNRRITPCWQSYRNVLKARGFRLDTVRDVKEFYKLRSETQPFDHINSPVSGYLRACEKTDDDALCPDAGLPDNLFRGSRICDGQKIMVKAVHIYSREYDVMRLLSTSPLRRDPMNHTIRQILSLLPTFRGTLIYDILAVLDLLELVNDDVVLIVMEEWSPQLITDTPCCLRLFLSALRQCIEHAVFLHRNHIAHLDISLRNLLTDYQGRYAYIDYELSRRFHGIPDPCLYGYRGTEVPPECERGERADPYMVDVWALGVLILRASKLTGYYVPELMQVVKPMLQDVPQRRPSIHSVLQAFDCMVSMIGESRLQSTCRGSHS